MPGAPARPAPKKSRDPHTKNTVAVVTTNNHIKPWTINQQKQLNNSKQRNTTHTTNFDSTVAVVTASWSHGV